LPIRHPYHFLAVADPADSTFQVQFFVCAILFWKNASSGISNSSAPPHISRLKYFGLFVSEWRQNFDRIVSTADARPSASLKYQEKVNFSGVF